jgi:hypothetical protein
MLDDVDVGSIAQHLQEQDQQEENRTANRQQQKQPKQDQQERADRLTTNRSRPTKACNFQLHG